MWHGELQVGDETLRRYGYSYRPPGYSVEPCSAPIGATIVGVCGAPNEPLCSKIPIPALDTESMPWIPLNGGADKARGYSSRCGVTRRPTEPCGRHPGAEMGTVDQHEDRHLLPCFAAHSCAATRSIGGPGRRRPWRSTSFRPLRVVGSASPSDRRWLCTWPPFRHTRAGRTHGKRAHTNSFLEWSTTANSIRKPFFSSAGTTSRRHHSRNGAMRPSLSRYMRSSTVGTVHLLLSAGNSSRY